MRWLSRGNATRRLFALRDELLQFFNDVLEYLDTKDFVARLAYLSNIFKVLNNFKMSFQGPNGTLSEFISKLEAFVLKLALWIENVKNTNTQY